MRTTCRGLALGSTLALVSCVGAAHGQPSPAPAPAPLPPDSAYVVVDDAGHLSVGGQRQRYWAVIGKISANNHASSDVLLDRFEALGFNAFRMWYAFLGDSEYTKGDGSHADHVDYTIARAKERGFRIWYAGLNRTGDARPEDVDILNDPETAKAWAEAVRELSETKGGKIVKGRGLRPSIEKHWDPRMEALLIRDMIDIATHFNQHTGLRYCDDPVFAVWELSNEEWWMRKMVGGQWQKLPAFFRNGLVARWNVFLVDKYGSDAALAKAWDGLLDGESLERGTVLLMPMAGKSDAAVSLNDASPHAAAAVEALEQSYSRDDFARARGGDVLEFFMGLQLAHKQRVAEAIKKLGKATRLSPMIYDTGIGYEIQSQYLHQNADAVAHDAYVNGYGPPLAGKMEKVADAETKHQQMLATLSAERLAANDGPWVNWLRKPPGIAQGVPWLEHNRVEGKPFLVYETQIQQPAKYRADFPLRVLALASIQDWDWVCWHYFGSGAENSAAEEECHFDQPMDITTGDHPQGYHFTYDEVQSATMRAAGHMFRGVLLDPAKSPTVFVYGRKSLYDPASMDYAGSYGKTGFDMLQTVYQHGVRIRIDPGREDDEVIGPVVRFEDRHTHNPYTPTPQITFDWKKGYLKLDAPAAVGFAGAMAEVGDVIRFGPDIQLSQVQVHNPRGIYDPIADNQKYIAFALYAKDGKPLDVTRAASLSLVSTSFNSGFEMGDGERPNLYMPPRGTRRGDVPVLVARVGGNIHAPALNGMRYTLRDWHLNAIGEGTVSDGTLVIPADKPVFVVDLNR